jgi:hypothetical protein
MLSKIHFTHQRQDHCMAAMKQGHPGTLVPCGEEHIERFLKPLLVWRHCFSWPKSQAKRRPNTSYFLRIRPSKRIYTNDTILQVRFCRLLAQSCLAGGGRRPPQQKGGVANKRKDGTLTTTLTH